MREHVVEFAPEALEDLRCLYDWIADAASPAVALAYVARIETFCPWPSPRSAPSPR